MKASELRIGNYLLCYGKLRQVVEIGLHGFLATSTEGQSAHSFEHAMYQPIPITEEWLLNFGFKDNTIRCGLIKISVRPFETVIQGIIAGKWKVTLLDDIPAMLRSVQYVHELQNLYFALTGEELTIK